MNNDKMFNCRLCKSVVRFSWFPDHTWRHPPGRRPSIEQVARPLPRWLYRPLSHCRHSSATGMLSAVDTVVNHTIVTDPTIWQLGFDLPHQIWSVMNRFRTGQGPRRANMDKWGLAQSSSCDCGQRQTMNDIVDTCPLTKFEGRLNLLHKVDDDAVIWLESTATAALAK